MSHGQPLDFLFWSQPELSKDRKGKSTEEINEGGYTQNFLSAGENYGKKAEIAHLLTNSEKGIRYSLSSLRNKNCMLRKFLPYLQSN